MGCSNSFGPQPSERRSANSGSRAARLTRYAAHPPTALRRSAGAARRMPLLAGLRRASLERRRDADSSAALWAGAPRLARGADLCIADGLDLDSCDDAGLRIERLVARGVRQLFDAAALLSGQFSGKGIQPPAGDDDIGRGKSQRQPLRRPVRHAGGERLQSVVG